MDFYSEYVLLLNLEEEKDSRKAAVKIDGIRQTEIVDPIPCM